MAEKLDNGKPPLSHSTPRTVLFPDSSISGKLSYNLPVKIDSRFSGEIKASDLLVVGANAQVDAHISARQLQVEGKLVGNIQVVGCFEIMPGGQFRGEFKVGELKVHPGAVCEGKGKVLGLADGVAQLPEGPSSP
jgi:cytoskeletal protein CcmA (bactofilin family)